MALGKGIKPVENDVHPTTGGSAITIDINDPGEELGRVEPVTDPETRNKPREEKGS